MDTPGGVAPSLGLSGALILLLPVVGTRMSTTLAELQQQLDAQQIFCQQRQLSIIQAKTKGVYIWLQDQMSSLHAQWK